MREGICVAKAASKVAFSLQRLLGSNYSNPADVEINTLETNFFSALKNDH